jgi:hypothetical protein
MKEFRYGQAIIEIDDPDDGPHTIHEIRMSVKLAELPDPADRDARIQWAEERVPGDLDVHDVRVSV